jgi:hypothetical protein
MTHAFFKALLFLGAGSVIMGCHHNQDIRYMGGLRKYMRITWFTSLLGSLALIGTPLFAGFYSKDSIIEAVHESHLPAAGFANFAVLAGVFVTAFYSFRMYFLVFHGKERFDQNPDAHHDDHHDGHGDHGHHDHHPHESPWVVTVPLVLLAIPSVVIGYLGIEYMLYGDFFKGVIHIDLEKHPAMEEMAHAFHGGFGRRGCGLSDVHGVPRCACSHQAQCHATLHIAGKQVLPRLDQREHPCARCARLGHRPVEGRRPGHHRWHLGQRLVEAGRQGIRLCPQGPVRLPLPLCAGHDPWRVCADDVLRLAQVGEK